MKWGQELTKNRVPARIASAYPAGYPHSAGSATSAPAAATIASRPMISASGPPAAQGLASAAISQSSSASAHTSDAAVSVSPRICSGDMYAGVPTRSAPLAVPSGESRRCKGVGCRRQSGSRAGNISCFCGGEDGGWSLRDMPKYVEKEDGKGPEGRKEDGRWRC
jgi:hypothetical protein